MTTSSQIVVISRHVEIHPQHSQHRAVSLRLLNFLTAHNFSEALASFAMIYVRTINAQTPLFRFVVKLLYSVLQTNWTVNPQQVAQLQEYRKKSKAHDKSTICWPQESGCSTACCTTCGSASPQLMGLVISSHPPTVHCSYTPCLKKTVPVLFFE